MCGRFLLTAPPEAVQRLFGFLEQPNLEPRYNIAPSQAVAAMIRDDQARRHFVWMRWGLLPSWSKEGRHPGEPGRAPLINARAETVAEKPSFRDAFARRRCVVFADGFYEWRQGGNRQPYCIRLTDGAPFAFAAIWEPTAGEQGEPAGGCALITTQANAKMAEVHHRMPVILTPEEVGPWLDPAASRDALAALLKPLPDAAVTLTPVSKRVNSVREDDAELLREEELPAAPSQLDLF
ncbi:SOS response-associated peptidase [Pelagibius sp. CAU 1746]|uniref:SOS response-associated peptidase n=1 Tax=Pelagibius sp. CAU 1746 TaxID=3140370 RepID=UPI00325A9D0F